MASSYWINAQFKGLIDDESENAVTVVTGACTLPDGSSRPATRDEYLAAVRQCAVTCPELAQTLARAVGAAILALEMQARGHKVTLVSVEGCLHRVGPFLIHGHEIVAAIWSRIVRPSHALPPQRTGGDACCTVDETRLAVAEAAKGAQNDQKFVQCVTHDYHLSRTDRCLREAVAAAGLAGVVTVLPALTPEQAAETARLVPGLELLRAIITAATLPPATRRWEGRGERLVRLLHWGSALLAKLTGGRFSLEHWLAEGRREALAPRA